MSYNMFNKNNNRFSFILLSKFNFYSKIEYNILQSNYYNYKLCNIGKIVTKIKNTRCIKII